eukprot:CAMPEP_0181320574 /NCGR_PEP_ID=MMETSP1101-20121128/18201_1 /TAXON_ID=46948 /ORGANISM="Rhodomonas abbreviata, Strain Caron Lab Isolate" /LENGTH=298 /DNA_ID=CAMNT_0023428297 /DNA_START=24 /DNA_END=920 /DNA_ORIENTATION=-
MSSMLRLRAPATAIFFRAVIPPAWIQQHHLGGMSRMPPCNAKRTLGMGRWFQTGAALREKETKLREMIEVLPSMTDLMVACVANDEEEVMKWIDDKFEIEAKDMDGRTPLMYAAQPGHVHLVKLLLEKGADVNVKDRDGKSVLTASAMWNNIEVMKVLIAAGAHVEDFDTNGTTALMYAAFRGVVEATQLLLDANADPNASDLDGRTPLMLAAASGKIEVARLLINAGARVDQRDLQGWTAMNFASNGNHEEFQALLQQELNKLVLKKLRAENVTREASTEIEKSEKSEDKPSVGPGA